MLKNRLKTNRSIFLGILLTTLAIYWGVWHGYFQQDEWSGFARVIYAQVHGYDNLVRFSGFHFTPLSILLVGAFYAFFGLHHAAYGWYSIIFHAINVFLVYMLAKKMTHKELPAVIAASIFLTASTPAQSVLWYAASFSIVPSTFFILLALIFFQSYLHKPNTFFLIGSFVYIFLGAGFRENAAFLFFYFPLHAWLMRSPHAKKIAVVSMVALVIYATIRFVPLLFHLSLTSAAPHTSTFRVTEIISQGFTFLIFYVPRLLIPVPIPLGIAHMFFGDQVGLARDSILSMFYSGLWIIGILFFIAMGKKRKTTTTDRSIVLSLSAFILLSLAPLAFLPSPLILESRHYYVTAIGYALLVGYIFFLLLHQTTRTVKGWMIVLISCLITMNILLIRQEVDSTLQISNIRTKIVQKISQMYPALPEKTIIYASGDPLPFQSGVGQMLMVLFYDRQDFTPLLQNYFLWGITEQGYKESQGKGFGYFTDILTLRDTYCQYKLTPNNVFALSWDKKQYSLQDITEETRLQLICPEH